jgi:MarR family transcriptional regulator, organic hydroperoxide resistance regulator
MSIVRTARPTRKEHDATMHGSKLNALPLTISRAALLSDGEDGTFRALLSDLLQFGTKLQATREVIARAARLTPPQYSILMAVGRWTGPGGPTVTEVAAQLDVSIPFIVGQNRALVAAKLLRKQPDPDDGRRVRLHLTPAGRKRLVDLGPLQRDLNDTLFASLNRADFIALQRIFRQLLSPLEITLPAAPPDAGSGVCVRDAGHR